ncbi:MAG TPA: dTDP-4-dehydrorhamnose 3,5-epimerase [Lichenihabitans sp.]|nr:dTDP-4-dehydrorhamnose 3,5-epimerase [Lichenihabitans sp.]
MRFELLGASPARLIHLDPLLDARGSYARAWCADAFRDAGLAFNPIQANASVTRGPGTIRGMHFQRMPKPDAKLVRCTRGHIYDVMVDLRGLFPTRRDVIALELREGDGTMLYVPPGFAHGFQCLSSEACVEYLIGERFEPELHAGFRYDDPSLAIAWPLPVSGMSERDLALPRLAASHAFVVAP